MNLNDDEAIGLINRLLERLHQADLTNFGSHLQIVYVASGAQHVENQIKIGKTLPSPPCVGRKKGTSSLPDVLATDKAMALWKKAQAALLADAMAERLGIKEKWKVFEGLWNRKNMYHDYYRAMEQQQSLAFQDTLKQLFE